MSRLMIAIIISLIVGILIGWAIASNSRTDRLDRSTSPTPTTIGSPATSRQEIFKSSMRKLWSEHAIFTREFIVSSVQNLPDTNQTLERLMKNQQDIGDALKPYYGASAGNRLTTYLKEHISIAGEVVTAAKANDQSALNQANQKWESNGNQIVDFLTEANPNLSKDELSRMFADHLKSVGQQATDYIQKNYIKSISTFDQGHEAILKMSDSLSDGIIKQFPDKF